MHPIQQKFRRPHVEVRRKPEHPTHLPSCPKQRSRKRFRGCAAPSEFHSSSAQPDHPARVPGFAFLPASIHHPPSKFWIP